ncbi:MAG: DUF1016 N-terminal domain-containing protein [Oligosphaeraceae bacterium]
MSTDITKESTSSLYTRIAETIEAARRHVAQTANLAMVTCYYQIGRMIVEDEQKGRRRAGYGEKTLQALSQRLTERFGKGFSYRNLRLFRQFYQTYSSSNENGQSAIAELPEGGETQIWQSAIAKSQTGKKDHGRKHLPLPSFGLSWSHYLQLLRVEDPLARRFYEIEAAKGNRSVRWLSQSDHKASSFSPSSVPQNVFSFSGSHYLQLLRVEAPLRPRGNRMPRNISFRFDHAREIRALRNEVDIAGVAREMSRA